VTAIDKKIDIIPHIKHTSHKTHKFRKTIPKPTQFWFPTTQSAFPTQISTNKMRRHWRKFKIICFHVYVSEHQEITHSFTKISCLINRTSQTFNSWFNESIRTWKTLQNNRRLSDSATIPNWKNYFMIHHTFISRPFPLHKSLVTSIRLEDILIWENSFIFQNVSLLFKSKRLVVFTKLKKG
jgi:hypothetical protein